MRVSRVGVLCAASAVLLLEVAAGDPAARAEAATAAVQEGSQAPATPPSGDRVLTVVESLTGAVGGVAVDRIGFVYVADFAETVYKVTPDGRVSVFATGLYGASGNAVDSRGNLLQSSFSGDTVTRIDRHGKQEIVAAEGLEGPVGIAVDEQDDLTVCNCRGNYLARIGADGQVSRFAESDLFNCPNGITRGPDGDYYVVNFSDGRMLRVDADGAVSEFALVPGGGNGHVVFARGAFYVTGFRSQRIYKVEADGSVAPFAGTGALGEEDGAAAEATFSWPNGIAVGPTGDRLYVNDYVNRTPPTVPVPPTPQSSLRVLKLAALYERMQAALQSGGIEAMVAVHDAWKADPATAGAYTELELNGLGYALMNGGQLQAAIEVFELNVADYPSSANVYDSLGEAYMNAGETELAIANYERSLELNPANTNAVEMLEKLRQQ